MGLLKQRGVADSLSQEFLVDMRRRVIRLLSFGRCCENDEDATAIGNAANRLVDEMWNRRFNGVPVLELCVIPCARNGGADQAMASGTSPTQSQEYQQQNPRYQKNGASLRRFQVQLKKNRDEKRRNHQANDEKRGVIFAAILSSRIECAIGDVDVNLIHCSIIAVCRHPTRLNASCDV